MISGSELTAAARAAGAIRRALKRPDPVAVLERRQAVRQELEDNLHFADESTPEVVVIRLGKEDKYPKADERLISWSASPWSSLRSRRAKIVVWRCTCRSSTCGSAAVAPDHSTT